MRNLSFFFTLIIISVTTTAQTEAPDEAACATATENYERVVAERAACDEGIDSACPESEALLNEQLSLDEARLSACGPCIYSPLPPECLEE